MKKAYLYTLVVIIVVAAGGVWYVVSHKAAPTGSTNAMNMDNANASAASQAPVATNTVAIQNFAFSPISITVKAGASVTWTNKDSIAHTVTETDSQAGPSSGDVAPGASYSFTFKTAGTYHYHCAIHPEMTGTVVVTN